MANRLREMLDELVGPHQSAFIKGRNISENILLAHELVRNLNRDKGKTSVLRQVRYSQGVRLRSSPKVL